MSETRVLPDLIPADCVPRHKTLMTVYWSFPLTRRLNRHYAIAPDGSLAYATAAATEMLDWLWTAEQPTFHAVTETADYLVQLRPLKPRKAL